MSRARLPAQHPGSPDPPARLSACAGRLLTGPFAFLLAGLIDVAVYWAASLIRAARGRLRPSTIPRP
jgi:hypothetical protein